MARNGFKVLDSDMHVMEPPDLWQNYTSADFRGPRPQVPGRGHEPRLYEQVDSGGQDFPRLFG